MVQPVEIADTLSKTELASKLNQIKKANSEMDQRQFTTALKEKTSADAERTKESMKSDLLIITKDKQEQDERRKNHKKKKESDGQGGTDSDQSDDTRLDVKA